MASIFTQPKSPFYWLKWKNPATNEIDRFSTKIRLDDPNGKVKSNAMRCEHELKESAGVSVVRDHPFSNWVTEYLTTTHSNAPLTLGRYLGIWKKLALYLNSRKVTAPNQITREVALGYVPWRKKELPQHMNSTTGKKIGQNTALLEVKILIKIMNEAVRREYIKYNPCRDLGFKREPTRIKAEMTDEHVKIIQAEIEQRIKKATTPCNPIHQRPSRQYPLAAERRKEELANALFLKTSFEIARLQGIRLSETWFSLNDDVDWTNQTLRVLGKGKKVAEVNINPNLMPLLRRLRDEGETHTYEKPRMPGLAWFNFFDGLRKKYPGFKNVSFHSTRVTVISRMERAGVPENVMMKTVLHSSVTVHRVYRKVKKEELNPYWNSVGKASS